MKTIRIIFCSLIAMLMLTAIPVYASTYSLSQTKATVNIGDTVDLDVLGTEKTPSWVSYKENIASVDSEGVVLAKRTGTTTVSARIGLIRKKCTVKVVNPSIKLDKKSTKLYAGNTKNTAKLKATVKGATKAITWKSSDTAVATVDNAGKIKAISAGTAIISATANGKTATSTITVEESTISFNKSSIQLSTKGTGSSITLKPAITGANKKIVWTSSDKSIATVSSSGKVSGKKDGVVIITATIKGTDISAQYEVVVVKGSISIGDEIVPLFTGETKTLKTNASKKDTVIWTSSNEDVATVDENGKITTVGAGTAIITTSNGDTTDTCEVVVSKTETEIDEGIVYLKVGEKYTLNTKIVGRKSTKNFTTSEEVPVVKKKDVLSVSKTKGEITAKAAGTATITLTANGVKDTVKVVVEEAVPTITLNQAEYILYTNKGNTATLKATVKGATKTITWTSSNSEVVEVQKTTSSSNKITAKAAGTAKITATANGVSAECWITVKESKVILGTNTIWLKVGETAEVEADVIGSSQTVSYKAQDTKVATVDKNGKVKAKKIGETDIKVSANGITAICHVIVSDCEHNYNEGIIIKEATCSEAGIKEFTCVDCGNIYNEETAKTEHCFAVWETVAATCQTSGYDVYACENCNETYQIETAPASHQFGEWELIQEATEFVEGVEKHICTVCGTEEIRTTEKAPHQCVFVEGKVVEPTCEEGGYTVFNCICGKSYEGNITEATGHNYEVYEVIEPTCIGEGFTTYMCICGNSYEEKTADKLDHSWGEWIVSTEATETTEGEEYRECEFCGKKETQTIPMTGHKHNYEVYLVEEPTCEYEGYTLYLCECGDWYQDDIVPALEHSYEETTTKEATCTEQGNKHYECNVCGDSYDEVIPNTDHNYEDVIVEPTCEEGGYTVPTCIGCGHKKPLSDWYDWKDALGHNYECTEVVAGTCQTVGTYEYKCSRCDDSYTRNLYGKHNYEAAEVGPTCEEYGYTCEKCTECGNKINVVETTEPLNHSYDEGKVIKAATCAEEGIKEFNCIRCEDSYTTSIAKTTNHNYEDTIIEPTCTKNGYTNHICSICGDNYTDTETEALGHEKNEAISTVAASKEAAGYTEYSCTRCEETFKTDITYYQPTEEQVYADIMALQEKYPDGMEWTSDTKYGLFSGCTGFALMVHEKVFGIEPYTRNHTDYSQIKVGDMVSFINPYGSGHICVVLEVHDTHLIIVEGNAVDENGIGRVRWNGLIGREYLESHNMHIKSSYLE